MINQLKHKKVKMLSQYRTALDYNDYARARVLRIQLQFLDQLIEEVGKNEQNK